MSRIEPKFQKFGLIEYLILAAVVALAGALVVANWPRSRSTAAKGICIAHLKQIDGAKQQWALEMKQLPTAIPTPSDLKRYLKSQNMPACLDGGTYTINAVSSDPTCSKGGQLHSL
jgi:competence protein ComGC